MPIVEGLVTEGAVSGTAKVVEKSARWLKANRGFIACSLLNREHDARVVRSAIVCIKTDEGRYLLVRNLHRPEHLAPFGGVYKVLPTGQEFLNKIEFMPHVLGKETNAGDDLRGFIKRKHLPSFNRWSNKCSGREDSSDCLHRELAEELAEVGIKLRVPPLRFLKLRRVTEGPKFHSEVAYTQHRVFDVFALDTSHNHSKKFAKDLILKARKQLDSCEKPDIEFVTPAEIREGRSNRGTLIAHHANYFFANKTTAPHAPLFPKSMRLLDALK